MLLRNDVWKKALNRFQEAPASTSNSSYPGNRRTFGHFRACRANVYQALTRTEGARWPTCPDKAVPWS